MFNCYLVHAVSEMFNCCLVNYLSLTLHSPFHAAK